MICGHQHWSWSQPRYLVPGLRSNVPTLVTVIYKVVHIYCRTLHPSYICRCYIWYFTSWPIVMVVTQFGPDSRPGHQADNQVTFQPGKLLSAFKYFYGVYLQQFFYNRALDSQQENIRIGQIVSDNYFYCPTSECLAWPRLVFTTNKTKNLVLMFFRIFSRYSTGGTEV